MKKIKKVGPFSDIVKNYEEKVSSSKINEPKKCEDLTGIVKAGEVEYESAYIKVNTNSPNSNNLASNKHVTFDQFIQKFDKTKNIGNKEKRKPRNKNVNKKFL